MWPTRLRRVTWTAAWSAAFVFSLVAGCATWGRGPGGARYHVVAKGETAYGIARRYGVALEILVRANALENPGLLYPGTGLWIPGPGWDGAVLGPISGPLVEEERAPVAPPPGAGPPPDPIPRVSVERADGCDDVSTAVEPPETVSTTGFSWPVNGIIIGRYGPPPGLTERGVIIAAPVGTPVRAAAEGVVMFAGQQAGFGRLVVLRHADQRKTFYGRNAETCVTVGQRVARGAVVGLVGASEGGEAPSLYFEMRQGERSVSPRRHLPAEP